MTTLVNAASGAIDDLHTLVLVDGLPLEQAGKTLRYRTLRLRETNVGDERAAVRMAERMVTVNGKASLVVSEADFRYAMTLRHCESWQCDGQTLSQALLDIETFGKLSTHDLGLIEQRIFLLTLAAQVRYGALSQEEFEHILGGQAPQGVASPQPMGQTASAGAAALGAESGPAMLADYAGGHANGAA